MWADVTILVGSLSASLPVGFPSHPSTMSINRASSFVACLLLFFSLSPPSFHPASLSPPPRPLPRIPTQPKFTHKRQSTRPPSNLPHNNHRSAHTFPQKAFDRLFTSFPLSPSDLALATIHRIYGHHHQSSSSIKYSTC